LKEEYFKIVQFFSLKIDGGLPVFAGILGSMFVCALIAVHGFGKPAGPSPFPLKAEAPGNRTLPRPPRMFCRNIPSGPLF
jgi:hypothetical protein